MNKKFLLISLLSLSLLSCTNDVSLSYQNNNDDKKVLIAYFSCTNNTRGIANKINNLINSDLF